MWISKKRIKAIEGEIERLKAMAESLRENPTVSIAAMNAKDVSRFMKSEGRMAIVDMLRSNYHGLGAEINRNIEKEQ